MLTGSTTSGAIQLQGNGSQAILLPPSGILTGGNSSIQLSPNATVVARDLSVEVDTAPPPNAAIQFMFSVNGAATPLSCIVQAGATSCQNSADAVTIPPGSQITLFVDNPRPASSTATGARWGWRAMTP
jgi:hypothetical protein